LLFIGIDVKDGKGPIVALLVVTEEPGIFKKEQASVISHVSRVSSPCVDDIHDLVLDVV
jgi:hypothetical protein